MSPTSARQRPSLLTLLVELRNIISALAHELPTHNHIRVYHNTALACTNRQLRRETLDLLRNRAGPPRTLRFYIASHADVQFAIRWLDTVTDCFLANVRRIEIKREIQSRTCSTLIIDLATTIEAVLHYIEPSINDFDTMPGIWRAVMDLEVRDGRRVLERRGLVHILYRTSHRTTFGR